MVDEVLRQGVQGIADLITVHGLVNVDFADVKAIMENAGSALMGIGYGTGENRAANAAKAAIESPLLEMSIDGAKGILFNIVGGNDLSMFEVDEAARIITDAADPEANIIFGAAVNDSYTGEIKITVVATGFDESRRGAATMFRGGIENRTNMPSPVKKKSALEELSGPIKATENEYDIPAFIRRSVSK